MRTRTIVSDQTPVLFQGNVRRALEYIAAGDIYQINLAQRFTTAWPLPPELLYRRLREQSPARFGAFAGAELLDGRHALACISPELLLAKNGERLLTRPIKGTRARPATALELAQARSELDASPKERAELNMIVDLERNDLGRVCSYGSVRVESPGEIEELPTLLHRTATVSGTLDPGASLLRVLKAIFPGGSVTGAPKKRAMEIIAELERSPRGMYCGMLGWLSHGALQLNLPIRTAVIDTREGLAHYHAGSGIVADSQPVAEYDETLAKAAAFFRAVNGALA